jgi:hypothetical protein
VNNNERRYYERAVRVNQFGIDNAGDFTGKATAQFTLINTLVGEAESEAAKQQSGFGEAAQQFEIKDTAREDLREAMSAISRTAKSMEYEFDGISDKFLFRRNLNDVDLLAKARAFIIEATPYTLDFKEYGLNGTFVTDLTTLADAFEASFASTATAQAEHVSATAETFSKLREINVAVRTVDGIVRNRYANDPGKLAAWLSASHVEKAPKKKDSATP